jgi:CBS domain-containing membrane protein
MLPRIFRPIMAGAHLRERLIGCLGALICIGLTMFVCGQLLSSTYVPIIVAPLGASAVLIFAVPSSPLAQPWPVVGGNMISAFVE